MQNLTRIYLQIQLFWAEVNPYRSKMEETLNVALLTQSEMVTQDPAVQEELCPQFSQFCNRHGSLLQSLPDLLCL